MNIGNLQIIKKWIKVEEIRGTEVVALCPFHEDTHSSFSICMNRMIYYCFSCGAKGKLKSDDKRPTPTYEHFEEIFKDGNLENNQSQGLPAEYKHIDSDSIYLDYLFSRGLSLQTIKKFRLGYCESGTYADRIIVPLKSGFVARTIHSPKLAKIATGRAEKYLFPLGLQVSKILFNYGDYDPIVLCEGVFDVMHLYEMGYNVIGIFGARLHQKQLESLCKLNSKKIILALDGDGAGNFGAEESAMLLKTFFNEVEILQLPDGKDPGEVNQEIWDLCYKNLRKLGGIDLGKYNDIEIRV